MSNSTPTLTPRAAAAATEQRMQAQIDAMQLYLATQLEANNKATAAAAAARDKAHAESMQKIMGASSRCSRPPS